METDRMTPAKLLALKDKRMDRVDQFELPIARLAYLFVCSKRDPGDSKANPPRSPSPEVDFDSLRFYKRRKSSASLSAKLDIPKPGGKHNVMGAKADRGAFEAFSKGKSKRGKR